MMPEVAVADPAPRVGPVPPGALFVTCDPGDPVILVTGSGLWTVEQMRAHLDEYRDALVRKRGLHGARVIVELQDTGVQLPAVTEVLTSTIKACHQPNDRIAMIVPSALARIQMRRVLNDDREYFGTIAEARAWLLDETH